MKRSLRPSDGPPPFRWPTTIPITLRRLSHWCTNHYAFMLEFTVAQFITLLVTKRLEESHEDDHNSCKVNYYSDKLSCIRVLEEWILNCNIVKVRQIRIPRKINNVHYDQKVISSFKDIPFLYGWSSENSFWYILPRLCRFKYYSIRTQNLRTQEKNLVDTLESDLVIV